MFDSNIVLEIKQGFAQNLKYKVHQITFCFWKMIKKKTTEYFLKFLFLFESTILSVRNGK